MAISQFSKYKNDAVETTSKTRAELTKILEEFRSKGKQAEPIKFGTHRKPEAVLVPIWLWNDLLERLDSLEMRAVAGERLSNAQDARELTYEQFEKMFDEAIEFIKNSKRAENTGSAGV